MNKILKITSRYFVKRSTAFPFPSINTFHTFDKNYVFSSNQINQIESFKTNFYSPSFQKRFLKVEPSGSELDPIFVSTENGRGWRRVIVWGLIFASCLTCYLILSIEERKVKSTFGDGSFAKGGMDMSKYVGEKPKPILHGKTSFKDVKGIDETKEELEEIIDFLRNPEKYNKLGGKVPKGVLLHGKPGTGKTLLAKAVAGESDVPFFYSSGSSFEEVFVGVGAKRIRMLFEEARKHAPCIIFIDEIDSLASKRGERDTSYSKMTLNQFLAEMDGFNEMDGIVVIAATNFYGSLDEALTRPGRFDKIVHVPVPNKVGRMDLFKLFLTKIPHDSSVDLKRLAQSTTGLTGADINTICNFAAIEASKKNLKTVGIDEMNHALDRHLLGVERMSRKAKNEYLRKVSIHETSHAFVGLHGSSKVKTEINKVTIIPHGEALGVTSFLSNEDDDHNTTKIELLDTIRTLLAGRVAEEIFFGKDEIDGGAYSDLSRATRIAYSIVRTGMGNHLRALNLEESQLVLSEETKREIDLEARKIVEQCYQETRQLVLKHQKTIEKLSNILMEQETIDGKEFEKYMNQFLQK